MRNRTGVGIIGCGTISEIYLKNLTGLFQEVEVLGVCDLDDSAAERRTHEFSLPNRYRSYDELLADPKVEVVLNLTTPRAHFATTAKAIAAGKHVYSEKPLGITFAEASELRRLAAAAEVRLGSSPDIPLGAGVQTCRKLVDDGYIGRVVGASANLIKRGVETWHPNPDFLYQPGAGPLLDMGPYYLSAMVQIMGCVAEAAGMSGISFPTRIITSQPRYGEIITVNIPTYVNSLLRFESGALASFTATFDVHRANLPYLEIYGEEGTLSAPYPNNFGGPIRLFRPNREEFMEIPSLFGYADNSRGLGLADMCKAIRSGRPHRASADLAAHVLETLDAIRESAESGSRIVVVSRCERPAPMARNSVPGVLD
jgi:predicted dehydrogenase